MKYIPKSQAKKFTNIGAGHVMEYNLGDPDIDIAIVSLNGKYPEEGWVVNEQVKELLYVISGSGRLTTKDKTVDLNPGDQVLVDKGELFRYETADKLVVVAACTPAWTPQQHKAVNT
jgi:mannose-6-phosphate isomerase-like protein (cupin superfamily)